MREREQDIHKYINKVENRRTTTSGRNKNINIRETKKLVDISSRSEPKRPVINKQYHPTAKAKNKLEVVREPNTADYPHLINTQQLVRVGVLL